MATQGFCRNCKTYAKVYGVNDDDYGRVCGACLLGCDYLDTKEYLVLDSLGGWSDVVWFDNQRAAPRR